MATLVKAKTGLGKITSEQRVFSVITIVEIKARTVA